MGKRSFQFVTWTPAAIADGSALTNNNFQSVGANNAASGLLVSEIYIGGQAGSSSPTLMTFARDNVLVATPTALANGGYDGPLNTLQPVTQVGSITAISAGTSPTRSGATTGARLNLSFNAFGGIVRWVAYPGEEWGIIGVTQSISESTLSAYTGGTPGLLGSHIIYEAYAA
jgi:hypothetical protein